MKNLPVPLVAFAVARSLVSLDDVIASTDERALGPLGWGLARSLDDAQLAAFLAVARARQRGPVYPLVEELLRRGRYSAAFGNGTWLAMDLVDRAISSAPETGPWIAVATRELEALAARDETSTRTLLASAKVALRYLDAPARAAMSARLAEGFTQESERGDYAELDYPYGTIDPTLEMARTWASVGDRAGALAFVENREGRYAAFLNGEELVECARLTVLVPELESRFTRWADASTEQEDPLLYAMRWRLRHERARTAASEREVLALVARAEASEALAELSLDEQAPESWRLAARARLLAAVERHVTTLSTSAPASSPRRDWRANAFAIRQLRAALVGLVDPSVPLEPAQRATLAVAARAWATWFATEKTGDWLEHVYTASRFARLSREAIAPLQTRFEELSRDVLLGIDGWDAIFDDERAIEIARAAL
jgi:hypothetical protein